jgi:signal transduction histidine kinase
VKNTDETEKKQEYLLDIGYYYEYSNPDSALIIYDKVINLDKKSTVSINTVKAYWYKGIVLSDIKDEYTEGNINYRKALALIDQFSDTNSLQIKAYIYNSLGIYYTKVGMYDSTITNYLKSLHLLEEIGDEDMVGNGLLNLGILMRKHNDYDNALQYFDEALKIFEKFNDESRIANVYYNYGIVFSETMEYEKAKEYTYKSLEMRKKQGMDREISFCYNTIGTIWENEAEDLEDSDEKKEALLKAIENYQIALDMKKKLDDKLGSAISLSNLSRLYRQIGNYDLALHYAKEGLTLAEEIESLTGKTSNSLNLANAYNRMNNCEMAYKYLSDYTVFYQNLKNEESQNYINDLNKRYEVEKKQLQIQNQKDSIAKVNAEAKSLALEKEKEEEKNNALEAQKEEEKQKNKALAAQNERDQIIIYSFILGFILIAGLAILIYRSYKQKKLANEELNQKNEEITSQRDEIAAQRDKLNDTLDELKLTQNKLVESEKMASLANVVTGVAHEINTPVGIGITASSSVKDDIERFVDYYKKGKLERKELESFIDAIYSSNNLTVKNLKRAGELVKNFKMLSVDQQSEQKRAFNLVNYTRDVVDSLKPEWVNVVDEIEILASAEIKIDSFPGVFAQIFTNLITNSCKYAFSDDAKGKIQINFKNDERGLVIDYKDNGKGISNDILPSIFDPFVTSNKQKGTGLGMNIIYNLITQKLNGEIIAENTKEGGARFVISLPF